MEPLDRGPIDQIVSQVRGNDYPTTDLIIAIVSSDLFLSR